MAMNVSTDGPVRVVINMTPMIDVLLVLLIIFMAIYLYGDLTANAPGHECRSAAQCGAGGCF